MSAGSGKSTILDNEIFITDRLVIEEALEDLLNSGTVASLGRKGGSGDVWGHGVMWHVPPWVVLWRWLREPHVSSIACELAALECISDGVSVADFATCSVHDICAARHG